MHTLELLEQALSVAEKMGYRIRHEWLGGAGGGACEFAGQRWIFVDLALQADEQLEQVTEALKSDPGIHVEPVGPELRRSMGLPKAA